MPRTNLVGLIRHELGHLADTHVRQSGSERRADAIAKKVTGQAIRYDRDDIQTVGSGVSPRPRRLPR